MAGEPEEKKKKISTHAPAQGATIITFPWYTCSRFQPTLPHRERLAPGKTFHLHHQFQPTLPHRERLPLHPIYRKQPVFQPTLPHRERPCPCSWICRTIDFNPRSRTGSDRDRRNGHLIIVISTHAPAQGATDDVQMKETDKADFNPRSRTGSDQTAISQRGWIMYFNPRSRTGSDIVAVAVTNGENISTHAPAQGATSG